MAMVVDKKALFKPRLAEADVDIEGVGTVRVRALNRDEAYTVQQIKKVDVQERKILSLGMVDPALTEQEVAQWQQACPAGEMEPVTEKISELSGMAGGAAKSGLSAAGDEPRPGVRDAPGAEAVDDGGPAAAGNVE